MSRRTERLNDLIQEELSDLLLRELRDPRLDGVLISITHVEVAPDLSTARVSVSVMAEPAAQAEAIKALTAAGGYLHRELKHRIQIRRVPILSFRLDDSIEKGSEVLSLLDNVTKTEPE
jgi:ribosome-binding factor A